MTHLCHADGCNVPVPPARLMCLAHWRCVPRALQRDVWLEYRSGQEIDKRPSHAYLLAMRTAIASVAWTNDSARVKAITMTQPYASLIMLGIKPWETRGWRRSYRGSLAITAAKAVPAELRQWLDQPDIRRELSRDGIDDWTALPRGVALGTVTLDRIIATDDIEAHALPEKQRRWGDWSAGRYALHCADPRPFARPVPCTGALDLWDWFMPHEADAV